VNSNSLKPNFLNQGFVFPGKGITNPQRPLEIEEKFGPKEKVPLPFPNSFPPNQGKIIP